MLLFLDESIIEALEQYLDANVENIEFLIELHRDRIHYVTGKRAILRKILDLVQKRLGVGHIKVFEQIISECSDGVSYYKVLSRKVRVVSSGDGVMVSNTDNAREWLVPLPIVTCLSQRAKIIGEHLNDAKILEFAAKVYAIKSRLNHKLICLEKAMAGGSGNAPTVVRSAISEAISPVFCCLDSDRLYPDGPESHSCRDCRGIVSDRGVYDFYATTEREMENVIPLEVINGAIMHLDTSSDRDEMLNSFELAKDVRQKFREIYAYGDLKEGTCGEWVNRQDINVKKFYENVDYSSHCGCNETCSGSYLKKIGQRILEHCVLYLERASRPEMQRISECASSDSWLDIGSRVYAISFANKLRAT